MNTTKSKIPKSEILWKTDNTPCGTFYTTSDKLRTKYTLWKQEGDVVVKCMTASSPEKFYIELAPLWEPEEYKNVKTKRRNAK